LQAISAEEMSRFGYIEHPENVALALKLCQDVGVERQTALEGMWQATPDCGALSAHRFGELNPQNVFINGFAANDPQSTGQNWHLAIERFPELSRRIAIFNCRADRPERSMQLAESCLRWQRADHYLVIGSATRLFADRATTLGLDRSRVTCVENQPAPRILGEVNRIADRAALVVGMGNIGGPGLEMVHHYQHQCSLN
jgi:poly-gamma-glutamate synthase PgsB/CapB